MGTGLVVLGGTAYRLRRCGHAIAVSVAFGDPTPPIHLLIGFKGSGYFSNPLPSCGFYPERGFRLRFSYSVHPDTVLRLRGSGKGQVRVIISS